MDVEVKKRSRDTKKAAFYFFKLHSLSLLVFFDIRLPNTSIELATQSMDLKTQSVNLETQSISHNTVKVEMIAIAPPKTRRGRKCSKIYEICINAIVSTTKRNMIK